MSSTRQPQERKRRRSAATLSSDDESDCERLPSDSRPCQAERKRELERNRRNLINVRFSELEIELRRSAPPLDPTTASLTEAATAAKIKRIDKEAVLKEATQRILQQRKELLTAMERASAMMGEIENLRAEKVELRSDKAYLRSELDTVRSDVQRLRSDNLNLWNAVRKSTALKNQLSSDVVKLPGDIFSRPKPPTADNAIPTTTTATANTVQPTVTPSASKQQNAAPVPSAADAVEKPSGESHDAGGMLPSDSPYLMYQSPEEIHHLFAAYVPGSATPVAPADTATSEAQPTPRGASAAEPRTSAPPPPRAQTSMMMLAPTHSQPLQSSNAGNVQSSLPMNVAASESLLAFGMSPPLIPPPIHHMQQFGQGGALATSLWMVDSREDETDRGPLGDLVPSGVKAESGNGEGSDEMHDIAPCV